MILLFFPEYKCSTKQLFYLGAPLRRSTVSLQYVRYFKLFRYEAAQDGQQSFDGHFTYRLGRATFLSSGQAFPKSAGPYIEGTSTRTDVAFYFMPGVEQWYRFLAAVDNVLIDLFR
jgi:hypothetical protein